MSDKQITKLVVLIFTILSLIIIILLFRKIYIIKIEPIHDKEKYLENIKRENSNLISQIKLEEKRKNKMEVTLDDLIKKKNELEEKVYKKIKENNKIIYLTFDDGPSIYTDDILNILDKYNVKATFFVVCSDNLEEYAEKYIQKGHTIGLHSCSHKYYDIYSSELNYMNDLKMLSDKIEQYTGYKSKYVRFPGGSSNTVSKFNYKIMTRLSNLLIENGYKYYDWNIDSSDAAFATSKQIYSNVIGALEKNNRDVSIILMHDTKVNTLYALEDIIKDALKMGYVFLNINDHTEEVHHVINN